MFVTTTAFGKKNEALLLMMPMGDLFGGGYSDRSDSFIVVVLPL
jgi:hypothetical protein